MLKLCQQETDEIQDAQHINFTVEMKLIRAMNNLAKRHRAENISFIERKLKERK